MSSKTGTKLEKLKNIKKGAPPHKLLLIIVESIIYPLLMGTHFLHKHRCMGENTKIELHSSVFLNWDYCLPGVIDIAYQPGLLTSERCQVAICINRFLSHHVQAGFIDKIKHVTTCKRCFFRIRSKNIIKIKKF